MKNQETIIYLYEKIKKIYYDNIEFDDGYPYLSDHSFTEIDTLYNVIDDLKESDND